MTDFQSKTLSERVVVISYNLGWSEMSAVSSPQSSGTDCILTSITSIRRLTSVLLLSQTLLSLSKLALLASDENNGAQLEGKCTGVL